MTNEIQIFTNPEFGNVRTLTEADGTILFCGKDVAEALGYLNISKALNDHCRGVTKRYISTKSSNRHGSFEREVEYSFITEPDLYRLIVASKLPSAQKFERWVFEEVLPTIRKTGGYLTPEKVEEALCNPDVLIDLAQQIKSLRAQRDEAIRTKYHIMAGRDATAMNTASRAVQRAKKAEAALAELKNEIGVGEEWKKLKPLKWPAKYFMLTKGFRSVFGKYVKDWCEEHGIEPHKVPDPDYGAVNAYPAWALETIRKEIEEFIPSALLRYRKKGR